MFTYYHHQMKIACGHAELHAELSLPLGARSIIIFSPEQDGISFSSRNRLLADHLHKHGFGTLFPELLTREESTKDEKRFDLDLLTARLMTVTESLRERDHFNHYTLGYFGNGLASTAVLQSAAYLPEYISAVVCCNARPDFVNEALPSPEAPTLLIGATQLFEDSAMTDVAKVTADWFAVHLHPAAVAQH